MILNFDSFIPNELMFAIGHPLAENLTRRLPDVEMGSTQEIREIQLRDRIPGLIKRLIPLNPVTSWEYWWCVPGRMLLPEDVEVLQRDRPRVDAILAKIVWLLGGNCFGKHTPLDRDCSPVYDWQEVLAFVAAGGLKPDLLDIDFFPTAIEHRPHIPLAFEQSENQLDLPDRQNWVAIEPAHWHIEFFQLQPIQGGFEIAQPKQLCSCQIWTGRPFIKNLKTGETLTRYDLWVSCPYDMISPVSYNY